ncbi:MAG: YigZ family protein [Firmicutes bacterium]|nr:YigZ family protein [Bacillota bacterium]
MAVLYTTAAKEACAEQTIERSRFIAYIRPVSSREEAEAFFDHVNDMHKDARHCVPAFVIGDKMQLQWASDNGEPQGTAGAPIVQLLVKEGVTNVAVGVIRYFGGIKLGTGGLVRAYSSSARLALEAAGRHDVREMTELSLPISYSQLGRLQNAEKTMAFEISGTEFAENVRVKLLFEPEQRDAVMTLLTDIMGGKWIEEPQAKDLVV